MQHGSEREAVVKKVIAEDLAVMFFTLFERFKYKTEENEFVCGIFVSQDELSLLANEHIEMKSRRLYCEVTASVVMECR
ncbi:uncharacterized protein MONOS_10207 [Monocercomonoides exilis]|uniref:uncharacterized protein n=1 Tax=Monocercomonoides exilis TaxID=2049356 RepID=UPI00355A49B3|nr:hypothetical protein MONOS_10207 [Monocercomonoides exilis]|eukprot:MONOS_10207.1-p1 / transcript=MONOS_10207.1 / gene=MONOS_10207 / organism=Monocercomonoides_exilis_PA203 / gene_product=unspecified product / transcript_product=unspecified product / location=Mono_scaffold00454:9605-9841(-) / protein_length=79 / sequence_SO=supercontig / SO=protein_coding / is_pseudo=false